MKLGISGQALGNVMNFKQIIAVGKALDIYDFEIWPCNTGDGAGYRPAAVKELARICDGEGVRVYCVTYDGAFDGGATRDAQLYSDKLMEALDAARELGAKAVNHYCYHISLGECNFSRMEQFWTRPLRHAEETGVKLALENEAHDATRTPEGMLSVLKHFDSPYFLTNYDATNYLHASCEGYPAGYEILKAHLGYVHLKNGCLYRADAKQPEYNRGAAMSGHYNPAPIQYCPLPDGAVNIPGLLTRLQEDGTYDGVCTLEPHTRPEHVQEFYTRESKWLRRLGFFVE